MVLTDFGFAKQMHVSNNTSLSLNGSPRWMGPEYFASNPTGTFAVDTFAFGMALFELTTGELPFSEIANELQVMSKIQRGQRPILPSTCHAHIAALIRLCWNQQPERRPTAEQILAYFDKYDDDLLPAVASTASTTTTNTAPLLPTFLQSLAAAANDETNVLQQLRKRLELDTYLMIESAFNRKTWLSFLIPKAVRLFLIGQKLNDNSICLLCKLLEKDTRIEELDISYNGISRTGAEVLARMLHKNRTLRVLYLDSNDIGAEETTVLADALKVNVTLERLILSDNKIEDQGCVEIAHALEKNNRLKDLNMSLNKIGDMGCDRLARALAKNTTLQKLSLASNCISDQGCASFKEKLKTNMTLQVCKLSLQNTTL